MNTDPTVGPVQTFIMPERHINFYDYHPSLAAAAIFVVLFAISTVFHCIQSIQKRAWFMTPFIIGGFFETIGYIGRILSSDDPYARTPFIMQTLLILLAPALFAASIYMVSLLPCLQDQVGLD